jgi:NDP-sugar pyrophosphorylase family protein
MSTVLADGIDRKNAVTELEATPVLILAGGKATRLGAVTKSLPKALVPVAGVPFIDHQLAGLRAQGIREVVMCVGHLADQIHAHVGEGARFGLKVRYSEDGPIPQGTGGAVRQALALVKSACFVLYGDSLLDVDYAKVLANLSPAALGVMTVFRNENSFDTSNVLWRNGTLVRYSKRGRTAEMTHIDYGLSLLRREAIEKIPANQPSDLADLYTELVDRGEMIGVEVTKRFYEIGSPAGLREAEEFILRRAG